MAREKGAARPSEALDKVAQYTMVTAAAPAATAPPAAAAPKAVPVSGRAATGVVGGVPGGVAGGVMAGSMASTVSVDGAAGVPLYKRAQELEQLSRTDADRKVNAVKIKEITGQLSDQKFVTGFGSYGGEEFFSYLNISDSLHRTGGQEWQKWNGDMKAKLLKLQNEDGTWAGHHCITGRVAVTSAAILLLTADREPAPIETSMITKKR
jgi:hypothetical protein